MRISLLTDARKHNLALMKISAYHKRAGDEVMLNMPLWTAEYSYASWIFEDGMRFGASEAGGIGLDPKRNLPGRIEKEKPDYGLFNLGHSLGYTFRACFRKCEFCKVPLMEQDTTHHSIFEFHDPNFSRIELLNNNTFFDPLWEETFKEIYKANLVVIDNGHDLRLLDDKKAWWLKRLKWVDHSPRFAWDRVQDEKKIREGLRLLRKHEVKGCTVYVLMGFDTTFEEEDLYRCEIINGYGYDPYPMLFKSTPTLSRFRKFLYGKGYRNFDTIAEAWRDYMRTKPGRR